MTVWSIFLNSSIPHLHDDKQAVADVIRVFKEVLADVRYKEFKGVFFLHQLSALDHYLDSGSDLDLLWVNRTFAAITDHENNNKTVSLPSCYKRYIVDSPH